MLDLREVKEFLVDSFKYIIVIAIVLFLCFYVVTIQQVVGPSMQPKYNSGDVLILNKLHYRLFEIKRFDIVDAQYNEKYLVKRVIGLPGETIEFKNNELYANGKLIEQDFIMQGDTKDFKYENIRENTYFVVGDNREDSLDSRTFGVIEKKDILGKVMFKIWPLK